MSSPSLTPDKGLPKQLEELGKSHLEGDLRHKQPRWGPAPTGGEAEASEKAVGWPVSQLKGGAGILRMAAEDPPALPTLATP